MSNSRPTSINQAGMATSQTNRFRGGRNMPSWVTGSSDRVGPPPPPPPINTDPEYEVIDVVNQQYSNAPPPVPLKSQDIKRLTVMKCDLCGSVTPAVRCEQCDQNLFCASCDDRYHRHPKRQTHVRKPVEPPAPSMVKPPLPPKGEAGSSGPLPPPRRKTRPGSFHFPSPLVGRKQDQTIPTTVPQGTGGPMEPPSQQQKPPPPPPSPALSLREKMNSLKRFIHPSNRPLPDPPENKIHSSNSSIDSTSKRSPSATSSARSMSTTMEKIQNNTAATLDRMTLLQQRYRQHQEAMKSDGDRSRRASLTSNTDLQSSATESSNSFRSKPSSATFQHQPYQQQHLRQPYLHASQQALPLAQQQQQLPPWLNVPPPAPRMRSGSVASGINLLTVPAFGDSANNTPSVSPTQHSEFGDVPLMPGPRSTSVFNLHQQQQQPQPNMWGFSPLHQAQSMAHFNPMQWNQMNAWMARGSQNGSNMSLNLPPQHGGYPPDPLGYPPGYVNNWGGMYPYPPMGMMPMMPGVVMPPPRSRANSRSRAGSPALSGKSRKSTMSMRNVNRNSFVGDLTDDEDSDDEFHRARGRDRRRRERLNSTSSIEFDEPEQRPEFVRASSVKHSRFSRRVGGSSARSLIDYPVSRKPGLRYERDEGVRERLDKLAVSSPRAKPPSDSFTNESDLEPADPRRAPSNRSRSGNESISSPRKLTSDSLTNDSDVDFERTRQAKLRAAQNNLSAARRVTSDSLTNDSDPDHAQRRGQKPKVQAAPVVAPSKTKPPSSESEGHEKQRRKSETKMVSKSPVPKKIASDSHTPDTDGEQKRRFATKQQRQRKHSSTEFIANESDEGPKPERKESARHPPQVVNGTLEFRNISPSKSAGDSDEQRHLKTVEIKNIINESSKADLHELGRSVLEDSPPPAAPVAPDCEWECEFCTYVNEAGVKICAICCKTASISLVAARLESNDSPDQPRSPPPDVVQETPQITEGKLQIMAPQKPVAGKQLTGDVKKKDGNVDDEATETDWQGVAKSNTDEKMVHECGTGEAGVPGDDVGKAVEGFEIGHNLASEVVQVEKRVIKQKVSTGCGPSPPRDVVRREDPSAVADDHRGKSQTSIGTSPPPQDMSTQTYATFEQVRDEKATREQAAEKPPPESEPQAPNTHQEEALASALYKRSHSLATPQMLQVEARPASRHSISSDTQSLPPSPHELSPQPGLQSSALHHQYQPSQALNQTSHLDQSSSSSSYHHGLRQTDDTMSYLDHAINQIIQTAASQTVGTPAGRSAHVENKYRTFTDLRRIDTVGGQVTAPAKKPMHSKAMDDQLDVLDESEQRESPIAVEHSPAKEEHSEMALLLREAKLYQFTAEELQAAMNHCGEKHPVQWLRDNWSKLIETVQTLATKYGHEKRENTIGTISINEAREALRLHKGNIWRAITECIEQRQRKYRDIAAKGNFTREDIVTSLTAHHGNLELALLELSKTQLKPFLMRIWGPPNGADNDSSNLLLQQALQEDRSGISNDIEQFISAHVERELLGDGSTEAKPLESQPEAVATAEAPEGIVEPESMEPAEPEIVAPPLQEDLPQQPEEVCEEQAVTTSNTEILKDIEALILQMERNQGSPNVPVLRNIQQLLTQLAEPRSRSNSVASVRSQASDRIISKSPIPTVRNARTSSQHSHDDDPTRSIEDDVRDFVEENIQDILPNLVHQVRQELESVRQELRPATTTGRSLEDDIRETLLKADYTDDDYGHVHEFPLDLKFHESLATFPERPVALATIRQNHTQSDEGDGEYANIQQFLHRAIRNEKATTVFDQCKRRHYQIDSSSDEARQTAESTDYYDLVSINQKLMHLFNKPSTAVQEKVPSAVQLAEPTSEEKEVPQERELPKFAEPPQTTTEHLAPVEITVEKKGMKKRRGSRIPVNKNNYLCRRPVKSSSESDFEALGQNNKPLPLPAIAIDHVEELRHVVENIERIEQSMEAAPDSVTVPIDVDQIEEPIYSNVAPVQISVVEEDPKQPSESAVSPPEVPSEQLKALEEPVPPENNVAEVLEAPQNTSFPTADTVDMPLEATTSEPKVDAKDEPQNGTSVEAAGDEVDEDLVHNSKLANNLSELVLDTKRLIQQMKDEINSDIATFDEEDAAYDGEYYEDEYEEEWEGEEEEEEEWDSNEEYDVDENGDFYEYEDDDDDGSVMFSEMTIIDSANGKPNNDEQPQGEEMLVPESPRLELPKINVDAVRENERNSASEVSDLPLDSDFNDALSVIEQSVGEMRSMLRLTEEALGPLDFVAAPLHHASSVETLKNSPEQSEISEATLVPELPKTTADESSEHTLVGEDNLQMTMKDVQTLINAKAVIGGFLKNVQKIEQAASELDNSTVDNMEEGAAAVIYDSVRTTSTETTENKQSSVIERTVVENQNDPKDTPKVDGHPPTPPQENSLLHKDNATDEKPEVEHNGIAPSSTASETLARGEQEATSVIQTNTQIVSVVTPGTFTNDHMAQVEVNVENTVQTEVMPHSETPEAIDSSHVSIPPKIEINEQRPVTSEATTSNLVIVPHENGVSPDTKPSLENTSLPIEPKVSNNIVLLSNGAVETLAMGDKDPMNHAEKLASSFIPEYANVIVLENSTLDSTVEIPLYASVNKKAPNLELIETHTPNQVETIASKAEGVPVHFDVVKKAEVAENTSAKESETINLDQEKTPNPDAIVIGSSSFDTLVTNTVDTVNEQQVGRPRNTETPNSRTAEEIRNHDNPASTLPGVLNEILDEKRAIETSDSVQTSVEDGQQTTISIQDIPLGAQEPKTEALGQNSNDHSSIKTSIQVYIASNDIIAAVESTPAKSITTHFVNGHVPDSVHDSPKSRASSEEPSSSFIEVKPSEVVIHADNTQADNTPPSAPPRTINIYQNVELQPSTISTATSNPVSSARSKTSSKLTVKLPTATPSQSEEGGSPSTPPTPTGLKVGSKGSASKTKTDTKKKSTTASASTESTGRKPTVVRKKSVGGPFGPVQTNTVKNMQKEFLSKARESPKPSTSKVSPKPAKLVQPKVFTNRPAANLPPGSSKASTPATDTSSARSTPGAVGDTGEPVPGPSRDTTYTCEKLLKKKYRETCFSDDYQTTDDEDESRMTITESERTIIKSLVKPFEPNSEPPEVQAKQLFDDGLVQTIEQAELAVQLIELRYAKDNAIWAATQCHTVDEAKDLLQKECELCLGLFPMNEIVSMLKCTHTCCFECAKEYYTQEITNRSITNCNCPYCKEPDLNGPNVTEDDVLEYFSNLDILLKNIVDEEVHDLFQRKIRDRTLTQDPHFKWCVHCSSGFFARPKQRRLICPDCGSITCASCRKPWETQHEGLSCDKFAEWKEANDPELQAEGVQRHLQTHGISCPNCKFRYSLARGGCMHFTCTQCKFEFCYGCNKPFMMGAKCSVSAYCAKLGLHAHHPRNCLFYLRDKEPRDLQNLLLMNNVSFDTEPSELMKQELVNGQSSALKCPIPLQKETPAGLMDMICSAEVPENHAGLCRAHYIEYLSFLVNKNDIDPMDILSPDDLESLIRRANKRMPPRPFGIVDGIYREYLLQIDPLPILDLTDCVQELRRRGIPLPERGPWDTDEIYREMCLKIVKDQIPLN